MVYKGNIWFIRENIWFIRENIWFIRGICGL